MFSLSAIAASSLHTNQYIEEVAIKLGGQTFCASSFFFCLGWADVAASSSGLRGVSLINLPCLLCEDCEGYG